MKPLHLLWQHLTAIWNNRVQYLRSLLTLLLAGTVFQLPSVIAEEAPLSLNINTRQILELISTFTATPDENSRIEIDRSSPGKALADIRRDILRNPAAFSKYATPVPFSQKGDVIGYQLKPNGNRALFDVIGIKPDDVILSINGVKLINPTEGLKALQKLAFAKQINMHLLRNGTEQPLQFDIP